MTQDSNRPSWLGQELLISNPLLVASDHAPNFRLDAASFAALQQIRNEVATTKLDFQVDVDDPAYALKTLRLLGWFDGQLEILQRLQSLHVLNTTPEQDK